MALSLLLAVCSPAYKQTCVCVCVCVCVCLAYTSFFFQFCMETAWDLFKGWGTQGFPTPEVDFPSLEFLKKKKINIPAQSLPAA